MNVTINPNYVNRFTVVEQVTSNSSNFQDNSHDNLSVIDTAPFKALRLVLEDLYDDENTCRRIVSDAGLTGSTIDFSGSSRDRWHRILIEFRQKDMLDKLVSVVRSNEEYGKSEKLNKVWQEYLDSQQKS